MLAVQARIVKRGRIMKLVLEHVTCLLHVESIINPEGVTTVKRVSY